MCGYYRQCLPNYAKVAEPIVRLTRKNEPFFWGDEQQGSFSKLKEMLMSEPVMAYPKVGQPYKLVHDACEYAVGAILVQVDEQGVERVIQYVSHQLAGSQLRWATIEKEAYAVVHALSKLRPYLYGAEFTVYTDHKPLTSLFTAQLNNTKIQRWAVLLAEYGAKIEYRKGKNNIRADMLSRIRPGEISTIDTDYWVEPDKDADTWFDAEANTPAQRIPILLMGVDPTELATEQKETLPELYEEAGNPESEYELHNNLLYSTKLPHRYAAAYPWLVAPPSIRRRVIERAHKDVGHMATQKTLDRVREAYVWPKMKAEVRNHSVSSVPCVLCTPGLESMWRWVKCPSPLTQCK